MRATAIVALQTLIVNAEWSFVWPYGEDYSCRCAERGSIANYTTEAECLTAFSKSDLEYCSFKGQSVNPDQCDHAVSIDDVMTNGDCATACTKTIAGSLAMSDFLQTCRFEFYAEVNHKIGLPLSSCFSTYAFGWSDYNPSNPTQAKPLKVLSETTTPAQCQHLCQEMDECVLFSWRGTQDPSTEIGGFQNEPQTCILFDQAYIDNVFAADPENILGSTGAYCDAKKVSTKCAEKPWESGYYNIFVDFPCLNCKCDLRCAWKTVTHISGPAFCQKEPTNFCEFHRPLRTTEAPECPTETCPSDHESTEEHTTEQGTAVTDTSLTTDQFVTPAGSTEETSTTVEIETTETTTGLNLDTTVSGGASTPSVTSTGDTTLPVTMGTATTTRMSETTTGSHGGCPNPPCPDECIDCEDDAEDDDCFPNC